MEKQGAKALATLHNHAKGAKSFLLPIVYRPMRLYRSVDLLERTINTDAFECCRGDTGSSRTKKR